MKAGKLAILSMFFSGHLIAGTMGTIAPSSWTQVMTLAGSVSWSERNDAQTLFLAPLIEKTYTVDNSSRAILGGEFFYGLQTTLNNRFTGQLGLAVAGSSYAKVDGEIWDDADPQFNNYVYNYKISHAHLAVKGKILSNMGYQLLPYISGSAGVGSNRSYDYSNTPAIFEAVTNPDFASNRKTSFTFTLGAGVQRIINQNWQVGLGYEFGDWGKSGLGLAPGQTLGTGLEQSHLYVNGVMLSVSYVA